MLQASNSVGIPACGCMRHCQAKCITKSHLILLITTRTDVKLLSSGCSNILTKLFVVTYLAIAVKHYSKIYYK